MTERPTDRGTKLWWDESIGVPESQAKEVSPNYDFYSPPYQRARTDFDWGKLKEKAGWLVGREGPIDTIQGGEVIDVGSYNLLLEDQYKSLLGVHDAKLVIVQGILGKIKSILG